VEKNFFFLVGNLTSLVGNSANCFINGLNNGSLVRVHLFGFGGLLSGGFVLFGSACFFACFFLLLTRFFVVVDFLRDLFSI
jgi:hypothetical protein